MKKILAILALLGASSWAEDAFYRHHQRTTTTSLEADLVAREVGIDASARNSLIAKKADGNMIHVVSKEMDTASLNGVLNVAGQANLSGAVKMANYTSGRVPYFSTGGLITDASTLTFNGTALTSDTVAAILGLRIGNVAASNVNLYRLTANMLKTDDSLTVAGKLSVTDSILGGPVRFTGSTTLQAANAASEYDLTIKASRGSLGSPTNVVNNDYPYNMGVSMYSGGTYFTTGQMAFAVDGAFTSGQRPPSRFELYTNQANAAGVKQLSIAANGATVFTSTVTADSLISPKSYEESSFTGALQGCATSPTGSVSYVRTGKVVFLKIPELTAVSDSTGMAITGMPASLFPSAEIYLSVPGKVNCQDNSTQVDDCTLFLSSTGVIRFLRGGSFTGFAGSNNKGTTGAFTPRLQTFSYTLQ